MLEHFTVVEDPHGTIFNSVFLYPLHIACGNVNANSIWCFHLAPTAVTYNPYYQRLFSLYGLQLKSTALEF